MSVPTRPSDDRTGADSPPRAAVFVLVWLPTIIAAAIGAAVGFDINGIPGGIAGALFVGFSGFLVAMSVRSMAGPISRRALPGIAVAVLLIGLTAYLLVT